MIDDHGAIGTAQIGHLRRIVIAQIGPVPATIAGLGVVDVEGIFHCRSSGGLERRDQPTTILILLPAGSRVSIPEAISATGEAAMLRRARISASVSASGTTISN